MEMIVSLKIEILGFLVNLETGCVKSRRGMDGL